MNGAHFSFNSSGFVDADDSRALRVNEAIGGHALSLWLGTALGRDGLTVSDPWVEDHGWEFDIRDDERVYLCTCSIEEDGAHWREGHVTLTLTQSLFDRLRGRNAFDGSDKVARAVADALGASCEIIDLERA